MVQEATQLASTEGVGECDFMRDAFYTSCDGAAGALATIVSNSAFACTQCFSTMAISNQQANHTQLLMACADAACSWDVLPAPCSLISLSNATIQAYEDALSQVKAPSQAATLQGMIEQGNTSGHSLLERSTGEHDGSSLDGLDATLQTKCA
jgi:hypothetical protein